MSLRPFFSYYGSKWRISLKYPAPKFSRIIEPFAGSAGYSLHYPSLSINLYEINPVVYGVWDYLIRASQKEILSLPLEFSHISEVNVCQEAKWLIGFWLNKASVAPCNRLTKFAVNRPNSHWGETIRNRIAYQIKFIRHWRVFNKSYEFADNVSATWFVDPPYAGLSGRIYKFNDIDYSNLGKWCQSRYGQLIVCEMEGADWLPFLPFLTSKVMEGYKGKSLCNELIYIKFRAKLRIRLKKG